MKILSNKKYNELLKENARLLKVIKCLDSDNIKYIKHNDKYFTATRIITIEDKKSIYDKIQVEYEEITEPITNYM